MMDVGRDVLYVLVVLIIALSTSHAAAIDDKTNPVSSREVLYIHRSVNNLNEKLEEILDNMKELKETVLGGIEAPVDNLDNDAADIARLHASNVRDRRDTDAYSLLSILIALYDESKNTSTDVKTILSKLGDLTKNIDECKNPSPPQVTEKPRSCMELLRKGHTVSGVYEIYVAGLDKTIEVYCDQDTEGGGWIVFQRRKDGSINFFRTWKEYKEGFGELEGEFWLGNEDIHQLTSQVPHDLRIELQDFDDHKKYAKYSTFKIGPDEEGYILTADGYSGNAGNSFGKGSGHHNGHAFSTKDVDHDTSGRSCAQSYKGGWWYDDCYTANLNGLYLFPNPSQNFYEKGIIWYSWKGWNSSLKFVEMKIREQLPY